MGECQILPHPSAQGTPRELYSQISSVSLEMPAPQYATILFTFSEKFSSSGHFDLFCSLVFACLVWTFGFTFLLFGLSIGDTHTIHFVLADSSCPALSLPVLFNYCSSTAIESGLLKGPVHSIFEKLYFETFYCLYGDGDDFINSKWWQISHFRVSSF